MTQYPDATGHFDEFGGSFVPEALHAALDLVGLGPGSRGVRGVEGALGLPPVLPGGLDPAGQFGGVPVRRLVHLFLLSIASRA